MHLLELTFGGFNFSRFLAVVNFANINSNEKFCPVGYICALIFSTCILCLQWLGSRCSSLLGLVDVCSLILGFPVLGLKAVFLLSGMIELS